MDFAAAMKDKSTEVLEVVATLSLEAVKPDFEQYLVTVAQMVTDAVAITITDDGSLKYAVSLGGAAKKIAKQIDAKKKEVTADASDFVKSVSGFCKIFTDKLDEVETGLKKKIADYNYKVELERRKQEEAARKAAEELQAKLRAEAEELNRKAREEAARKAEEETRSRLAKEAEERAKKQKEDEATRIEREKREAAEIEAARLKAEAEAKKHEVEAPTVLAPVIPEQQKVTRTESGTSAHVRKSWKGEIENTNLVPREYCSPDQKKINDAIKMGVREIPGVRIYEDNTTVFRT